MNPLLEALSYLEAGISISVIVLMGGGGGVVYSISCLAILSGTANVELIAAKAAPYSEHRQMNSKQFLLNCPFLVPICKGAFYLSHIGVESGRFALFGNGTSLSAHFLHITSLSHTPSLLI